jgi:hypothetical protein
MSSSSAAEGAGGRVKSTAKDATAAAAGSKDKSGGAAVASAADGFNPKDANGNYVLDMAVPSQRQVAVELLKLAEQHGVDTWKEATLDKKAFSIKGVSETCPVDP